jgi:hypothetical protein
MRLVPSSSSSNRQSGCEGVVLYYFGSVHNLRVGALSSSERFIVAGLVLSGSLQFMTLLPGITIARVIAVLAAFVALNIRLVVCPFVRLRSLLLSFSRTLSIGTWLAFRSVELHLLQPVVVVSLGRNVPLDLRVRLTLEVTTLLF